MSVLEKKLDRLIAGQEHVLDQEVTLDFIRKKRDADTDRPFDTNTRMGGYIPRRGLRVLTQSQAIEIARKAYAYSGKTQKGS